MEAECTPSIPEFEQLHMLPPAHLQLTLTTALVGPLGLAVVSVEVRSGQEAGVLEHLEVHHVPFVDCSQTAIGILLRELSRALNTIGAF